MAQTQPGSVIFDRFEVLSLIQEGGQALVWKGRDRDGGGFVAIKELITETTDLRRRFERENSVRLESPYIVQPCEVGEFDGHYFLVMEFVEGENLSHILDREGKILEPHSVAILRQVAEGLRVAHESNIIHRDIKPENIMLDSRGMVKITDFGIACFLDKDRFTRIGSTLGTAHYMAPEQVEDASKVDSASDMFSLGIVFYEMLTGRKPFDGKMMGELFLAIVTQDPVPPRRHAPEISPEVEALVMKMLQKSPESRFPGMAELVARLDDITGTTTARVDRARTPLAAPAPPPPPPAGAQGTDRDPLPVLPDGQPAGSLVLHPLRHRPAGTLRAVRLPDPAGIEVLQPVREPDRAGTHDGYPGGIEGGVLRGADPHRSRLPHHRSPLLQRHQLRRWAGRLRLEVPRPHLPGPGGLLPGRVGLGQE